mmetsp:Transcript_6085/g.14120  ORF Transcript_6085/g.14120 Transcript_6085/m.14120 type:complete len:245 (-) Transcript_6085:557-1291(-)
MPTILRWKVYIQVVVQDLPALLRRQRVVEVEGEHRPPLEEARAAEAGDHGHGAPRHGLARRPRQGEEARAHRHAERSHRGKDLRGGRKGEIDEDVGSDEGRGRQHRRSCESPPGSPGRVLRCHGASREDRIHLESDEARASEEGLRAHADHQQEAEPQVARDRGLPGLEDSVLSVHDQVLAAREEVPRCQQGLLEHLQDILRASRRSEVEGCPHCPRSLPHLGPVRQRTGRHAAQGRHYGGQEA